MRQEYEGRAITVLRNAQSGDIGFDADKHHQLFARFEDDGSERAVNKDYVRTLVDEPAHRTQFEGSDVEVLRAAKAGDTGYLQGAIDQVLIKLADGSEMAVTRAELRTVNALRPGDAPRAEHSGDAEHALGKTGTAGGLPQGPVTLDGKAVTVLRKAARGDQGFDEEKPSQILVQTEAGGELVVMPNQLTYLNPQPLTAAERDSLKQDGPIQGSGERAAGTGHVNQSDTQHADAKDQPAQMQYQGQNVTVERDAREGDEGYRSSADQVLIALADGSRRVVHRIDVRPAQAG